MENHGYPLIATKIRPPRRGPSLLRRERLLDQIHTGIHRKLILVAAAAGYGKTSLLVDYVHDTDLPVCWYTLDSNDAHPLTFLEYLVAAIRQRFPGFGDPVLEAVREHTGPVEAVEPFVRLLIHEIETRIDQYFVLVLDDYHEVIDSEAVNALIDGLLRYLPEHCHAILASRGIPRRLTLTRLAARDEVVGIGVEHLRFNAGEIAALLTLRGDTGLTQQQIETLAQRTEGWITGILLAAQASDWSGATRDILAISGATGGVFDFLAEQVFARQSAALQRFLLGSALLHEMTPPLCDALLDITNSADLLQQLVTANLFTFSLDGEGIWFQYHQLFQEFLVAKFQRDDPRGYRELHLRQAELLEQRGRQDQAVDSYLAAEAWEQAAAALELVAQDAFDSGQWEALKRWTSALPEPLLQRHPRLLLFQGKVHYETGDLARAATLLEHSYQAYADRDDALGSARALVQSGVVQRMRAQYRQSIQTSRQALDMAGGRDALVAVSALRNLGISTNMLGQLDESIAHLEAALNVAEANADEVNSAYTAHDLGTAELRRGRLVAARQYYHRALMYWRKIGNASALAGTLEGLGVVHHYLGQYVEADDRYEEALVKARLAQDSRLQAYGLASRGDLYRDTGKYEQALEVYDAALAVAADAQVGELLGYIRTATGDTLRLKGDLQHALQVLIEVHDLRSASEPGMDAALCDLALGALAYQQDEHDRARELLTRADALFTRIDDRRDAGRAQLYLALVAAATDDQPAVRACAAELQRLADALGSHQFIVAEGPLVRPLLAYAQRHALPLLDSLTLRAELAQLFPDAAPEAIVAVRESKVQLELLGLNGGRVLFKGEVIGNWEATAARVLAFALASHPNGLRREQIIEMLWPEISPAKGNGRFYPTLHRLRRALAPDIVTQDNGLLQLSPDYACRYDLSEFRQLARMSTLVDEEAAHLARVRAIDLYKSDYLVVCENDWAEAIRRSARRELLNLLLAEAAYLGQRGHLVQAEGLYRRAMGIDALDERIHRGLIWCRARANDQAGAIHEFQECQLILERELDAMASARTVTLYKDVLAGRVPASPPH
ncbi:MAG: tetratricopeptide repeat protein [Chloroflexi bacterium]|nr:tetratricopeptide repeat protein [Chloroflexota bacterium]